MAPLTMMPASTSMMLESLRRSLGIMTVRLTAMMPPRNANTCTSPAVSDSRIAMAAPMLPTTLPGSPVIPAGS